MGGPTPLNEWIHIAGTYDRAEGVMRLYYNGKLEASNPIGDKPIDKNTEPLRIGRYAYSVFPGSIDEVRIYNRVLTAMEIQKHYVKGLKRHQSLVMDSDRD